MGNRASGKGHGGSSGNRDNRSKIRSSGMKQRGKGSSSNYTPSPKKSSSTKSSGGGFFDRFLKG